MRDRARWPPTVTSVTTKSYAPDLTDTTLREEIELVADLVVAAAGCSGRMNESQIDEVLGLCPRLRQTA
jgi:heterodisulfide reductase subunit A-like polyferredoxin